MSLSLHIVIFVFLVCATSSYCFTSLQRKSRSMMRMAKIDVTVIEKDSKERKIIQIDSDTNDILSGLIYAGIDGRRRISYAF